MNYELRFEKVNKTLIELNTNKVNIEKYSYDQSNMLQSLDILVKDSDDSKN